MKSFVFCLALFSGALAAPQIPENVDTLSRSNSDHIEDKLHGANVTTIEKYPYQVSLRDYGIHVGGGSVLTTTRALTVAHLLRERPLRYTIKAGSSSQLDSPDPNAQIRTITGYVKHPEYHDVSLRNDIAILQWDKPLVFGAAVQPVVIPPPNYAVPYGKLAETAGWGWTPKFANRLHVISTPLVNNHECSRAHPDRFTPDMVCAGFMGIGQGICVGDYGGALVDRSKNQFLQIGVASWSEGCGAKGLPDVYTRVPLFSKWIRKNL